MIEPLVRSAAFVLKWRFGLRSAVLIHRRAATFASSVELSWNGRRADAKNLIDLVCLCSAPVLGPLPGDRLDFSASGPDAEDALAALADLFAFGARVDRCPRPGCPCVPSLSDLDAARAEYACARLHLWTVDRRTGKVFAD